MGARIVRTLSGSICLLEQRPDGSEWIARVSDPHNPGTSARLRREGVPLRVLAWLVPPQVGQSMAYAVDVAQDGVTLTYRTSTPVASIVDAVPNPP